MVSTKPYLVRAIYEWCMDQGFTPFIAARVDANTRVPPGYARDGRIVLNVAPDATHQLSMDNELVSFQARFNGVAHHLSIPMGNVVAIYARENGHGMAFEPDLEDGAAPEDVRDDDGALVEEPPRSAAAEGHEPEPPAKGSHLKVVK
ncbi:ClpXP protease specificity-enhancing factor [Parazoarcus communis]|uniref:ClpXP protease specificity-enhancing factor n=1 Tax=Parazoarcus communis SWub3 = DSM 12120 TaxID=1121029 RepID=A0A323UQ93_9RHOO|nr:ClpXP protease specificity-enhancing factor [Parazoarcus communis]NMG72206.1 ClpXP protease specificity-enhancing factor [Parazoarcus communis SWub3 = DSM 12120]PZA14845.1 ClpXP protease specificity-enhancing factor [Azoarcus communis] [Parazoarcus communis SWub3 = DSM 12120]